MKNKDKNKKQVISKKNNSKKVKAQKKLFKNKILLIIPAIVIIMIIITIILIAISNKEVTCTKTRYEDNVSQKYIITFNKKNEVSMTEEITTSAKNENYDYLDIINYSLDGTYKDLKVDYSIKKKDNKLIVNAIYNKKQSYIIDGISLSIQNGIVGSSIISEDSNNEYVTVDLNKGYSLNKIIKDVEKKGYKCED